MSIHYLIGSLRHMLGGGVPVTVDRGVFMKAQACSAGVRSWTFDESADEVAARLCCNWWRDQEGNLIFARRPEPAAPLARPLVVGADGGASLWLEKARPAR